MPYVERDGEGTIVAVYQAAQIGFAEEFLADDHADMVALALNKSKQAKIAAAGQEYGKRLAAGVSHGGKVYQIDDASQQRIGAMASRALAVISGVNGATWPDGFVFIAADNSTVEMTAAQMYALAEAASDRVIALRVAFRTIKDSIVAASDAAALDAIDITANWP
jgi:hypothetical protein